MFHISCALWCQADNEIIEVQLNNVWITGVIGNPAYIACKNCHTKIDMETGHCKRHDTHGCQTQRDEEMAILATVNLADHTGEIERVLVDGAILCDLVNAENKEELLDLLSRRGPQGLCFRQPVDVRLATNARPSGAGRSNMPPAAQSVLQSQESDSAVEILPECQFQIVAAQTALYKVYDDESRPMIRKVLRLEKQRAVGMVYPIKCPYDDLQFSSFGVKIRDAAIFPNYITMLVRVENEEPKISKVGAENDEIYMMQYKKVVAASAREPRKFSVEAFCLLQQSHIFNMADKKVHLLVGKVTADDDGGNMIVVAEKLFKLDTDQQREAVEVEREQILRLAHTETKKRPASELVRETPAKVKAGKWNQE